MTPVHTQPYSWLKKIRKAFDSKVKGKVDFHSTRKVLTADKREVAYNTKEKKKYVRRETHPEPGGKISDFKIPAREGGEERPQQ